MAPVKPGLPRLYMVTDSRALSGGANELPGLVRRVASALPIAVQLREKHLNAAALCRLGAEVRNALPDNGSLLCINERTDVALVCGASGVHFPEASCPVGQAIAPTRGMIAGKSAHSPEAALSAESEGADYLFFGPVFETPSKKPFGKPRGLKELGEVCRRVRIPVYAIGGIVPATAQRCLEAGAYGIAAISAFIGNDDLPTILDNFQTVLSGA